MLLDFRNSKFSQILTQMENFFGENHIFTNSKPKFICENPREMLVFTNFEPKILCENQHFTNSHKEIKYMTKSFLIPLDCHSSSSDSPL